MSRAKNKRHRSRSAERRFRKQKLIDQTEQKMIYGLTGDAVNFLSLLNEQKMYLSEQEWEDVLKGVE